MIDSASISPFLEINKNYFKDSFIKRSFLKEKLNEFYNLYDFNIFFIPSVRIGILILDSFQNKNKIKIASKYNYLPIEKSLITYSKKEYKLVTHIDPYYGNLSKLSIKENEIIVDASHSFATNLHDELISNSNIFLAPLHKHASITIGLSILCIRKENKILNSSNIESLKNIEEYTTNNGIYDIAIKNIKSNSWKPFNTAFINPIDLNLNEDFIEITSSNNIPFICFKQNNIKNIEGLHKDFCYFKHTNTIRIAYMHRDIANNRKSFNNDFLKKIKNYTT